MWFFIWKNIKNTVYLLKKVDFSEQLHYNVIVFKK
jgi:hypothetical protein